MQVNSCDESYAAEYTFFLKESKPNGRQLVAVFAVYFVSFFHF